MPPRPRRPGGRARRSRDFFLRRRANRGGHRQRDTVRDRRARAGRQSSSGSHRDGDRRGARRALPRRDGRSGKVSNFPSSAEHLHDHGGAGGVRRLPAHGRATRRGSGSGAAHFPASRRRGGCGSAGSGRAGGSYDLPDLLQRDAQAGGGPAPAHAQLPRSRAPRSGHDPRPGRGLYGKGLRRRAGGPLDLRLTRRRRQQQLHRRRSAGQHQPGHGPATTATRPGRAATTGS